MSETKTTVVCTAAVAKNLREISRRLGDGDMNGMFISGLSPTGLAPATHFISSGYIREEYLEAISNSVKLFESAKAAWEEDESIIPFTQAQVTFTLGKCTISNGTRMLIIDGVPTVVEESPQDLIKRLGLKFVQVD